MKYRSSPWLLPGLVCSRTTWKQTEYRHFQQRRTEDTLHHWQTIISSSTNYSLYLTMFYRLILKVHVSPKICSIHLPDYVTETSFSTNAALFTLHLRHFKYAANPIFNSMPMIELLFSFLTPNQQLNCPTTWQIFNPLQITCIWMVRILKAKIFFLSLIFPNF